METENEKQVSPRSGRMVELEWKHYIYEFLIVVLGISVPFVLSKINEGWVQKETEKQYYKNILRELGSDLEELQGNKVENEEQIAKFDYASQIISTDQRNLLDTLGKLALEMKNFTDFRRNSTIYQTLAQSGELDNFDNKELLTDLQKLDELYNYINRLESNHQSLIIDIYPEVLDYIRIRPYQVMKPEALFDFRFQNRFDIFLLIMQEKSKLYAQGLADIKTILARINKQVQ